LPYAAGSTSLLGTLWVMAPVNLIGAAFVSHLVLTTVFSGYFTSMNQALIGA